MLLYRSVNLAMSANYWSLNSQRKNLRACTLNSSWFKALQSWTLALLKRICTDHCNFSRIQSYDRGEHTDCKTWFTTIKFWFFQNCRTVYLKLIGWGSTLAPSPTAISSLPVNRRNTKGLWLHFHRQPVTRQQLPVVSCFLKPELLLYL